VPALAVKLVPATQRFDKDGQHCDIQAPGGHRLDAGSYRISIASGSYDLASGFVKYGVIEE